MNGELVNGKLQIVPDVFALGGLKRAIAPLTAEQLQRQPMRGCKQSLDTKETSWRNDND